MKILDELVGGGSILKKDSSIMSKGIGKGGQTATQRAATAVVGGAHIASR
jgi:hypothetical protein